MAASYIRGGANAVKKGISKVGSYILRGLDSLEESRKEMQEARNNSAPAYRRMKEEEERKQNEAQRRKDQLDEEMKYNLEAKAKGTSKMKSYVRKR